MGSGALLRACHRYCCSSLLFTSLSALNALPSHSKSPSMITPTLSSLSSFSLLFYVLTPVTLFHCLQLSLSLSFYFQSTAQALFVLLLLLLPYCFSHSRFLLSLILPNSYLLQQSVSVTDRPSCVVQSIEPTVSAVYQNVSPLSLYSSLWLRHRMATGCWKTTPNPPHLMFPAQHTHRLWQIAVTTIVTTVMTGKRLQNCFKVHVSI